MEDIEVKRFAVKYDPPTLVVEYKTSAGALFLKKIRIKVQGKMDAERLCNKIIEKNPTLLGPDHVCRTQLMDLISLMLQECQNNDANAVDSSMKNTQTSNKSGATPHHPAENNKTIGNTINDGGGRSNRSDRESKIQSSDDRNKNNQEKYSQKVEECDVVTDLHEVDLNKFDDAALSKVKAKMDVKFDSNRIGPGDPGYVWNKEVEFEGAEEACDWDEDDEEE